MDMKQAKAIVKEEKKRVKAEALAKLEAARRAIPAKQAVEIAEKKRLRAETYAEARADMKSIPASAWGGCITLVGMTMMFAGLLSLWALGVIKLSWPG